MKVEHYFRLIRLTLATASALALDAQGSSQTQRSLSFAHSRHNAKVAREVDPTRRRQTKRRVFAISAFGSLTSRSSGPDDAETILAKYGLQSSFQNESNPKATLPGSIQDERRRHYKSIAWKTCQLSFIFAASNISNNRIRLGVNMIRWAVATAFLGIMRWYGRLVASSPSELFRRIGYDLVDERGFVKNKYPIIDGDGSGTVRKSNGGGLAVVRMMPGDGSCLFYALAAGLLQSEPEKQATHALDNRISWSSIRQKAADLRQMAVDTLADESAGNFLTISGNDEVKSSTLLKSAAASFGMSTKDYCKSMRRASCWGGGVEMVALSNALNRQIFMYQPLLLHDGSFALHKIICFGPSKARAEKSLHVLIADNRFPATYQGNGQQKGGGNHFLAVFPV